MSVNIDELQAALGSARRWRNELRFAEQLADAAEKIIGAAGYIAEAEAAAKAACAERDKAKAEQVAAEDAQMRAVGKMLEAEQQADALTAQAKKEVKAIYDNIVAKANAAAQKLIDDAKFEAAKYEAARAAAQKACAELQDRHAEEERAYAEFRKRIGG